MHGHYVKAGARGAGGAVVARPIDCKHRVIGRARIMRIMRHAERGGSPLGTRLAGPLLSAGRSVVGGGFNRPDDYLRCFGLGFELENNGSGRRRPRARRLLLQAA